MAKSIPQVKIGNEIYDIKDKTAREHLIEVKEGNVPPTSPDNKLWIKGQDAEYLVPTYDEHNELKSAINKTNNAIGFYENLWNPSAVVEGKYYANGAESTNANLHYIIIDCLPGETIFFGNNGESAQARFVNYLTGALVNVGTVQNVSTVTIPSTCYKVAITFNVSNTKPQINKSTELLPYNNYGTCVLSDEIATKIDKNGENQVNRINLEGVSVGNYFAAYGEVDRENYYATAKAAGQDLSYFSHTEFNCYLIRVKKNTDYNITYGRFVVLLDSEGKSLSAALQNVTTFNSGEAEMISVSINLGNYPLDEFKICETGVDTVDAYIYPSWLRPVKPVQKTEAMTIPVGVDNSTGRLYAAEQTLTPKKYKSLYETGDLTDGDYLISDKETALEKGESLTFACDITAFDKLIIGWSLSDPDTQKYPYCEITPTSIIVHGTNINGPAAPTLTHGLTIAVNLQFRITIKHDSIDVELISNGERYTGTAQVFKVNQGYCFAMSDGSVLTNCRLSWCAADINKTVWMFGDSYFGLNNTARWLYYLQDDGFADNALLDAYPGRDTTNALLTLNSLITLGKPDYIVWCMGMNDGSDANSTTPSSAWVTGKNAVLSICESYGIIPVFATIPNVPSINHTGKNAWVKSSGYRYVDFAQAVGAETSGATWYTGMLSSDNVHPTAKGAKALYGQFLADFPEVTIP